MAHKSKFIVSSDAKILFLSISHNYNWFMTTHPQYLPSHRNTSRRSSSRFHIQPGSHSSNLVHDLQWQFPLQRHSVNMVNIIVRMVLFTDLCVLCDSKCIQIFKFSQKSISAIKSKACVSYLYSLVGISMYLCFQLRHKSYLDTSAGQASRWSNFQIFLERKHKEKTKWENITRWQTKLVLDVL